MVIFMKKRWLSFALSLCLAAVSLSGCGSTPQKQSVVQESADAGEKDGGESTETEGSSAVEESRAEESAGKESRPVSPMIAANKGELQVMDDKYRTFYEVFLYSFYDSDGDGIGDIRGLIEKLDYINDGDSTTDQDLGFNGIWLMPVMPSTTYHKYDVTDYCAIDKEYGTLKDFEELVEECHNRGINVIIDFVMNHTSSEHPWFTEACAYLQGLDGGEPSVEECPYVAYYNFSQTKESEVYYEIPGTTWYYEGKFWSGMPDLNLANEAVRREFEEIVSFWLGLGADGFRLDAAKEYYSDNTAANVEVLTWFNDAVKERKEDAYIVAEVWNGVDIYAEYYASGIDSVFNFAFANTDGMIANSVKGLSGCNASSYGKAVASLQERFGKYNENYIDAPFYTNHDIGRSAGYYSGDFASEQTKISAAMNLFMSGAAFVYYGEELGMRGAGKDENKRAPMYWSADKAAEGMCDGPKDMEEVEMKYPSFEEQEGDSYSIYNYIKQAVLLRNRYPEIARGSAVFVEELSGTDVCVLTKEYEESKMVLLFNLSENPEEVNLKETEWTESFKTALEYEVGGMLLTGEEAPKLKDGKLTLPAYSVVILK